MTLIAIVATNSEHIDMFLSKIKITKPSNLTIEKFLLVTKKPTTFSPQNIIRNVITEGIISIEKALLNRGNHIKKAHQKYQGLNLEDLSRFDLVINMSKIDIGKKSIGKPANIITTTYFQNNYNGKYWKNFNSLLRKQGRTKVDVIEIGGLVIQSGGFVTETLFLSQAENLLTMNVSFLSACVNHLINSGKSLGNKLVITEEVKKKHFWPLMILSYLFKRSFNLLRRKPIMEYKDNWKIGLIKKSNLAENLVNNPDDVISEFTEISIISEGFVADPFLFQEAESKKIYFEEYTPKRGYGVISSIEIMNGKTFQPQIELDLGVHASFPFLFKYGTRRLMVPESSKLQEVALYESQEGSGQWLRIATILTGISAADNLIFFRNDNWWLFTNIDSVGVGNHHSELHIYFSRDLITGPWIPHALNPILVDSYVGRNAGLFTLGDDIYRISQNHGFNQYGKSINVNKIVTLSEYEYGELKVNTIDSSKIDGIRAIHTLNLLDDYGVIDYVEGK